MQKTFSNKDAEIFNVYSATCNRIAAIVSAAYPRIVFKFPVWQYLTDLELSLKVLNIEHYLLESYQPIVATRLSHSWRITSASAHLNAFFTGSRIPVKDNHKASTLEGPTTKGKDHGSRQEGCRTSNLFCNRWKIFRYYCSRSGGAAQESEDTR
jgi:hypothetical protein